MGSDGESTGYSTDDLDSDDDSSVASISCASSGNSSSLCRRSCSTQRSRYSLPQQQRPTFQTKMAMASVVSTLEESQPESKLEKDSKSKHRRRTWSPVGDDSAVSHKYNAIQEVECFQKEA